MFEDNTTLLVERDLKQNGDMLHEEMERHELTVSWCKSDFHSCPN